MRTECKVCGYEFTPTISKHYIARDDGEFGLVAAFKSAECKLYDSFDCPVCGCQMIVQERKREYIQRVQSTEEEN